MQLEYDSRDACAGVGSQHWNKKTPSTHELLRPVATEKTFRNWREGQNPLFM